MFSTRRTHKTINGRRRECLLLTFTGTTEAEYDAFRAKRFDEGLDVEASGWVDGKTCEVEGRLVRSTWRAVLAL